MEEIIQKAYLSYYGRPADPEGLRFWTERLEENGGDLSAITEDFGQSEEFETRFGDLDEETLVGNLYDQVLGREADAEGVNFYTGQLNAGAITPVDIALRIADGARGDDVAVIDKRISVANEFTRTVESEGRSYGNEQVEKAAELVRGVRADTDFDSYIETALKPNMQEFFPPIPEQLPEDFSGEIPEDFTGILPKDFAGEVPPDFEGTIPEGFEGAIPDGFEGVIPEDLGGELPASPSPDLTDPMPSGRDNARPEPPVDENMPAPRNDQPRAPETPPDREPQPEPEIDRAIRMEGLPPLPNGGELAPLEDEPTVPPAPREQEPGPPAENITGQPMPQPLDTM